MCVVIWLGWSGEYSVQAHFQCMSLRWTWLCGYLQGVFEAAFFHIRVRRPQSAWSLSAQLNGL